MQLHRKLVKLLELRVRVDCHLCLITDPRYGGAITKDQGSGGGVVPVFLELL